MSDVIRERTTFVIDKNKLIRECNDKYIDKSDPIYVKIIKRIVIKRIVQSIRVVEHISDDGIQLEVKCDMP